MILPKQNGQLKESVKLIFVQLNWLSKKDLKSKLELPHLQKKDVLRVKQLKLHVLQQLMQIVILTRATI